MLDQRVDLDDHPVDFIGQIAAMALPIQRILDNLLRVVGQACMLVHHEAPRPEAVESLDVALDCRTALHIPDLIGEETERTRSRDTAVELPERTCGGIARIGKLLQATLALLVVQAFPAGDRHIDLAANLHQRGHRIACQPQWDAGDSPEIGSHHLARDAVATGGADVEHSGSVRQRHGETIDLVLQHEIEVFAHDALGALYPGIQLFG